jgi:starch phosphorylase
MKILVNGGLNLSELDGWWAEAYSPEVGWAIGDGQEHGDDPDWDAHEANELYELLEKEIVPAFYTADERGIPAAWVAKMRASMVQLTPRFSSNRAVREYVEKYYVKAAETYCQRATNESALGLELSNWSTSIAEHWSAVHFGQAAVHQKNDQYFFEVQVSLGGLDPNDVVVELYAEPQADSESFRQKMELKQLLDAPAGYGLYTGRAPAIRPAADYTSRVIPYHPGARVPIEANQILWQH